MATLSSILAWEIPWTEEPGSLSPWGHRRVGHYLVTKPHHQFLCIPLLEDSFVQTQALQQKVSGSKFQVPPHLSFSLVKKAFFLNTGISKCQLVNASMDLKSFFACCLLHSRICLKIILTILLL